VGGSETAGASATEDRKARARAWFEDLRDQICAAFEALEDQLAGTSSSRSASPA
jgi:coproporphyrinogen III oxidase